MWVVDQTGVIVAHELTDATVDDAATGVELIEAVGDDIASVTADAAYDTVAFYDAAGARGATVVVPPAKTARVSRRRPRSRARDRTITKVKSIGRRRWKKTSRYHQQARVENAFFRYKSIIGDGLRARTLWWANGRSGSRVQRTECDDRQRAVVDEARNAAAATRLAEERPYLRPLPSARIPEYTTFQCVVRKWSTIRVGGRIYSVPSRLIGHTVEARQHPSSEGRHGGSESTPRKVRSQQEYSSRGSQKTLGNGHQEGAKPGQPAVRYVLSGGVGCCTYGQVARLDGFRL